MAELRLGRLPARRPFGLSDLSVYAKGKLPAPPASVAVPKGAYPMDGNDSVGDCTYAGVDHLIRAWNVEESEDDPQPNQDAIEAAYFAQTGGQDTGCNEADVLQLWRSQGLFGRKIEAYAPVNPQSIVELHQAVAFFGGCYLGIVCPQSAQQQFQDGQPWTYVPGSPIEGGHCIVALGFNSAGLECATWGGIATVSYPFLAHFLEEAWAIIPNQMVERGQDELHIDLATLNADLDSL